MKVEFESILNKIVDCTVSSGEKCLDKKGLNVIQNLLGEYGDEDIHINLMTQSILLFSALTHKICIEQITKISSEYISYLNEELLDAYLEETTGTIQENEVMCLTTYLSDKAFQRLEQIIQSMDSCNNLRNKTMHVLSFSEKEKCIRLLKQLEPSGYILIPAGEFIFGSSNSADEDYKGKVWLPSYYISKYPVTQNAYEKNELSLPSDFMSIPCHGVSWYEAHHFATEHSVMLPTEAQWEKAARGVDGLMYPWGNIFNKDAVNSFEADISDFTSVGTYEVIGKSPFGVVDCVGNCWEWTGNLYDKYNTINFMESIDEKIRGDRVLRGGAYDFDRYGVTCTNRYRCNPENGWDTHGFRVVINL